MNSLPVLANLEVFPIMARTDALPELLPRARMREAKQWFCPVSQCVSHQNFGLITTTKGLNASKRHSNSDNSGKTVHGVPEGG